MEISLTKVGGKLSSNYLVKDTEHRLNYPLEKIYLDVFWLNRAKQRQKQGKYGENRLFNPTEKKIFVLWATYFA